MLYDPGLHEPLTDETWGEGRARDAIARIVADTDAAFDPEQLWPAEEWDVYLATPPLKDLYVGASGVIWALDALRRRGLAQTSIDLPAAAARTLELWRELPERDDPVRPVARSRPPGDLLIGNLLDDLGPPLAARAADVGDPAQVRVVDLPDRLDAIHELRELLELRPLVVGRAHRDDDVDRFFDRFHVTPF